MYLIGLDLNNVILTHTLTSEFASQFLNFTWITSILTWDSYFATLSLLSRYSRWSVLAWAFSWAGLGWTVGMSNEPKGKQTSPFLPSAVDTIKHKRNTMQMVTFPKTILLYQSSNICNVNCYW